MAVTYVNIANTYTFDTFTTASTTSTDIPWATSVSSDGSWKTSGFTFTTASTVFNPLESTVSYPLDATLPDHCFNALYGYCFDCHNSIHAMDPSAHPFLIDEEPDMDDWRDLLAS